jgi:uncharacterized protein (TIGR03083 family)
VDIWATIADERARLLELFEGLTPEQWDQPSLCGTWTMHELLAHLVYAADPPFRSFVAELVKARGSFDRANERVAAAEAERSHPDLLARYRERLDKRFAPPGLGPKAPLSDVILHSFDARIPLGLPSADRPVERYEPVLELLFSRSARVGFVPTGRPSLRWVAADHAGSHGSGDEVRGTMADLALAASGRGARLDQLTGPGQPALATWLAR